MHRRRHGHARRVQRGAAQSGGRGAGGGEPRPRELQRDRRDRAPGGAAGEARAGRDRGDRGPRPARSVPGPTVSCQRVPRGGRRSRRQQVRARGRQRRRRRRHRRRGSAPSRARDQRRTGRGRGAAHRLDLQQPAGRAVGQAGARAGARGVRGQHPHRARLAHLVRQGDRLPVQPRDGRRHVRPRLSPSRQGLPGRLRALDRQPQHGDVPRPDRAGEARPLAAHHAPLPVRGRDLGVRPDRQRRSRLRGRHRVRVPGRGGAGAARALDDVRARQGGAGGAHGPDRRRQLRQVDAAAVHEGRCRA